MSRRFVNDEEYNRGARKFRNSSDSDRIAREASEHETETARARDHVESLRSDLSRDEKSTMNRIVGQNKRRDRERKER